MADSKYESSIIAGSDSAPVEQTNFQREDSQSSDTVSLENPQELVISIKRDVERVFNLLLARAFTSHNLDSDADLQAILQMLEVTAEISSGSKSIAERKSQSSAPARSVYDVRTGTNKRSDENLPYAVVRAKSDTLEQHVADKSSQAKPNMDAYAAKRKQVKKTVKSAAVRRDVPFLRRVRRALRGLLQRQSGLEERAKAKKSQTGSIDSSVAALESDSRTATMAGNAGVNGGTHKAVPSKSTSTDAVDYGHQEEAEVPKAAAETQALPMSHIIAEAAAIGRQRDREREKRSAARRRFNKVFNEIRAVSKPKSKRESRAEPQVSTPAASLSLASNSTSTSAASNSVEASTSASLSRLPSQTDKRHSHSKSLSLSQSSRNTVNADRARVQWDESNEGLKDTINKYVTDHEYNGQSNNRPSLNRMISLSDADTDGLNDAKTALFESIADCVEHVIEQTEPMDVVPGVSSVTRDTEEQRATITAPALLSDSADTLAETKKSQGSRKKISQKAHSAPVPDINVDLADGENRDALDDQINELLRRCCTDAGDLFKQQYAQNPAKLRRLDKIATDFLSSSNYDLFASALRHESHERSRRCSCDDNDADVVIQRLAPQLTRTQLHSSSLAEVGNRKHASESGEGGQSDQGVGLFALFYLARRTADLGIRTVDKVRNVKSNLIRYFGERYAHFLVESGGLGALLNAGDDDEYSVSTLADDID